jgi:hypothetical protein
VNVDRKVRAAWIFIAILCFSTLSVSWLELSGSTEFTSGKPERSELIVEIEVDAEMETQSIRIEKATPFVVWMLVRDSVEEDSGVSDEEAVEESDENPSNLDNIRSLTILTMFVGALGAGISSIRGGIRMRWILSLWMAGMLLIVVGVPLAWMTDMGNTLDDGLPEDQGPNESGAFVHVNSETHSEVVFIGVEFHFDGDGWDLGMIDEENRSAAIEEPPDSENGSHDAHIGWDGEISLRYGDALTIWLLVGILLLFIFFCERRQHEQIFADEAE